MNRGSWYTLAVASVVAVVLIATLIVVALLPRPHHFDPCAGAKQGQSVCAP